MTVTSRQPRRDYEQSCRQLQTLGLLDPGTIPPMPPRRPTCDDEEPLGVSFFRTRVSDVDLSNLTLSRTSFGRSEISGTSFRNTDLSESSLCWNDFTAVNFTDCCLSGSDLRSAIFNGVNFTRCDLRNVDLRRSSFDGCSFIDADLRGARLTRKRGAGMRLSLRQQESVDWQDDEGEEPDGG